MQFDKINDTLISLQQDNTSNFMLGFEKIILLCLELYTNYPVNKTAQIQRTIYANCTHKD